MAPSAVDAPAVDALPIISKAAPALINKPLELSGALKDVEYVEITPAIGREFPTANLADWLNAPNADELIRDLAITSTLCLYCRRLTHTDRQQSPSVALFSSVPRTTSPTNSRRS